MLHKRKKRKVYLKEIEYKTYHDEGKQERRNRQTIGNDTKKSLT